MKIKGLVVVLFIGILFLLSGSVRKAQTSDDQVFTLASGWTTVQNGAAHSLLPNNRTSRYTWQVVYTGNAAASTMKLQGSIDNSNWFDLSTSTTTTSEMRHVKYKPIDSVRASWNTITWTTTGTATVKFIYGGK